jgi:hypothetical protein
MMAEDYSEKSISMEKMKKSVDRSIPPIKWTTSRLFATVPPYVG